MFCPNCGTQNPDTSQSCTKCNFALKGAAAPKFKGTMLMMNQPAVPGAAPPGGAPGAPQAAQHGPPGGPHASPVPGAPGGLPRPGVPGGTPGAQSAVPSRLKGTMVGVAPMSMGIGAPAPGAAAPAGAMNPPAATPMAGMAAPGPMMGTAMMPGRPMGGSSPPPGAVAPPHAADAASYSPPVAQHGVNPLGGTVAAEGGGFAAAAAYAQQSAHGGTPQPYGAPPGQPQYGAPAQPYGGVQQPAQQPYGAPPQQYGGSPQYGAPAGSPSPYGGPQQYGAPQGAHPMAPQGMMPYGGAMGQNPIAGTLPSSGVAAVGPTRRNALLTFLLPFAVIFGGVIVCTVLAIILGSPAVGLLSTLFVLAGSAWFLILAIQMANELKAVTGNPNFAWWPVLVPFFNLYWTLILVPQEVARAKQIRGVQAPVRSLVIYLFLWPFALASDLNDLAR